MAQVEDFEDETVGATTFTVGGKTFVTTGDFRIARRNQFSCDGQDGPGDFNKFIDTGYGDAATPEFTRGGFSLVDGAAFSISTVDVQCMWTGIQSGTQYNDGMILITGTLSNGSTRRVEYGFINPSSNTQFDTLEFPPFPLEGEPLIEIDFWAVGGSDYMAIDNFTFATVCPELDFLDPDDICRGIPFDIGIFELKGMSMSGNTMQNFGVEFRLFEQSTTDPYLGGISLGTVPFEDLTANHRIASLQDVVIHTAYAEAFIYAILSPTPPDVSCRPFDVEQVAVAPFPTLSLSIDNDVFCSESGPVVVSPAVSPTGGFFSGPGITNNGDGESFTFDPSIGNSTVQYLFLTIECDGIITHPLFIDDSSEDCIGLPVEFLEFTGEAFGKINRLSWSTGREENTDAHLIERSADAREWELIAEIPANGNSITPTDYTFEDTAPLERALYRIITIDMDGATTVSEMVEIYREPGGLIFQVGSIYPQPAGDWVRVKLAGREDSRVNIVLLDGRGKEVYQKTHVFEGDWEFIDINLEGLTSGIYWGKIFNGAECSLFPIARL